MPTYEAPARPGEATATLETPPPVSGRSVEQATPADVLARVERIRREVELLRLYMGREPTAPPRLRVARAQPRAVYRQVTGLFDQANDLSFELARTLGTRESDPPEAPTPPDVLRMTNRALERVLIAKQTLEIATQVEEREADASTTPTDTFHAVVAASAEINNLLERRTRPGDVYVQVTRAVHAAAAIHRTLPGARLPEEPPFEPNKTAPDVYRQLVACYRATEQLAASGNIEIIELGVTEAGAHDVSSHDVSELATLLSEELRYVHASWPRAQAAFDAYDPGLKFPAHVHQRSRYLLSILEDSARRAR